MKKSRMKRVLAGTLSLALLIGGGVLPVRSAQAAPLDGYGVPHDLEGMYGELAKPQPIVQSVSPAIGAATVRPDQTVDVQLNTSNPMYRVISMFASRFLTAYVLDGTNVVKVDKSNITFSPTTGKVSVQHPLLNPRTRYAVVVGVSPDGVHDHIVQDVLEKSLDVVTAVDTVSKTVTLLGHGQVPIDFAKWDHNPSFIDRVLDLYHVGDVVSVIQNKNTDKIVLLPRKDMGASTIFTTGSAIGELVNATASVDSPSVSVETGGTLKVVGTDDYGTPATNATVTVTGTGTGNSRVPSAFVPQTAQITNGTVDIPLTDHSAEAVNVVYTVQDGTYAPGTQTGSLTETFLAGRTTKLTIVTPDKVVAGKSQALTGEATDVYGNGVQDSTQVAVTPAIGNVDAVSSTNNGNYSVVYTAPAKVGAEKVSAKAADSEATADGAFNVTPDVTAAINLTAPSKVIVGTTTTITGTAQDQYGNAVEDGTSLTVTGKGSVPTQPVTTNGALTFDYTAPTHSGEDALTVKAADSGYTSSTPLTELADKSAVFTVKAPTTLIVGNTEHVTGTIVDQYGNPVEDYTVVTAVSSDGSFDPQQQTTKNGTFDFTFIAPTKSQIVTITATADGKSSDPTDVKLLADKTAAITVNAPTTLVVGKTEHITGTLVDQYGNPVEDNTIVTLTSPEGTIVTKQQNTKNGAFDFVVDAPTKTQAVTFVVSADGKSSTPAEVKLIADKASVFTVKAPTTVVVGKSEHVTGTVTDQYGNPVADGTIVSATSPQGSFTPSQQSTNGGAFDFTFNAPTKVQNVAVTVGADGKTATPASVALKADQPANISLVTDSKLIKADGTSQAHVSLQVTDQYGNPVIGEPVTLQNTGRAGIPTTVTTDKNGTATFPVSDVSGGLNNISASAGNGVKSPVASVVAAAPMMPQDKVTLSAVKQSDGSVLVSGRVVDSNGTPVPYSDIPLETTGGTLKDRLVASDPSGSFTTTLVPNSSSTPAKVAVPTAFNTPSLGIDPLIYGNQPWTDTGIDVSAGQTVRVVSTGAWAGQLQAQVGGTPVSVGADGSFVVGAPGRLYLGTGGPMYSGDVDSIIYLSGNANSPTVLPTLDLSIDKSSVPADGKSTAAVSGRVMEGLTPVIGATVNLSQTAGSGKLAATQVATDAQGRYNTTFTAGSAVETITITAQYKNLTQRVTVSTAQNGLKRIAIDPNVAAEDLLYLQNAATVVPLGDYIYATNRGNRKEIFAYTKSGGLMFRLAYQNRSDFYTLGTDGKYLLAFRDTTTLDLIDPMTGSVVGTKVLNSPIANKSSAAYGSNTFNVYKGYLYVGDYVYHDRINIYDYATGKLLKVVQPGNVKGLWAFDGKLIVTTGQSDKAYVMDLSDPLNPGSTSAITFPRIGPGWQGAANAVTCDGTYLYRVYSTNHRIYRYTLLQN